MIAQPITYEDFLPVSAAGIFSRIWEMKRWPEGTVMPAATPLNRRRYKDVRYRDNFRYIGKRKNAVNAVRAALKAVASQAVRML